MPKAQHSPLCPQPGSSEIKKHVCLAAAKKQKKQLSWKASYKLTLCHDLSQTLSVKGWLEAPPKYNLQVSAWNLPLHVQNVSLKGQRGEAGSCFTPEVHTVSNAVIGH